MVIGLFMSGIMNFLFGLGSEVLTFGLIWILCLDAFSLYTIRYAMLDWGPTFLAEMKGVKLQKAGWLIAGYEGSGILGMFSSGWLMDLVFKRRGGMVAVIYMIICTLAIFLFWRLHNENIIFYAKLSQHLDNLA